MTIKDQLEHQIEVWAGIGQPAIMERFVLRNGKVFTPKLLTGRLMRQGECFKNASKTVDKGAFDGATYVEGYGYRQGLGILIHHAWIGVEDKAIDVTWRGADNCEYIGVEITDDERWEQQAETGYYAILDNPATAINLDFIFKRDPDLKPIVEKIIGHTINLKEKAA